MLIYYVYIYTESERMSTDFSNQNFFFSFSQLQDEST